MKRVVLMTAATAAIGVAMADFTPTREISWYQTSIPSYVAGTDLTNQTETAGTWSLSAGFADQSLVQVVAEDGTSSIELEAAPGQNISFAASASAPAGADGSVVTTKLTFTPWDYGRLQDAGDVQGAFTMREQTAEGVLEFVGYTANGWVSLEPLDGVLIPADGLVATLKMQMDYSSTPAKVQYSLSTDDGTTWLTMADTNGVTWLASATSKTAPGQNGEAVEYSGVGTIHTLGQIGYDSTRAIAVCGTDGIPHYFATNQLAAAKAQLDADATASIYYMQDLTLDVPAGGTFSIDLTRIVAGGYTMTVNVPGGYKCVETYDEGTGLTTYSVVFGLLGSGTDKDPYIISDVATLKMFRDGVNDGTFGQSGEYFLQTADIDLLGERWVDVGTGANLFMGNYDGGNHKIENFVLSGGGYCGFFGCFYNGSLKNLRLLNVTSPSGSSAVSGVAGDVSPSGNQSVLFKNVTISGSITGRHNVGGFSAWTEGSVAFVDCTNLVNLTGTHSKIGGFSPIHSSGKVVFTNCLNAGNVLLTHDGPSVNNGLASAAGFVAWGGSAYEFVGCANTGAITSEQRCTLNSYMNAGCYAGAFLGGQIGTAILCENVSNTGAITAYNVFGTGTAYAGGLVAASTGTLVINGAYSTGLLTASNDVNVAKVSACTFAAMSASGRVTASGTNTALADVKPIGTGPCDGLNFATVSGGIATFCGTPSTSGSYKVMLANSENISFGAAAADTLALDMSLAAYSGTVTSLLDGYTATAGEPVADVTTWTLVASYPTYLADADATVKTAYTAWATANGADTASQYENAFLLDVSPRVEIPNAALAITEITKAVQGWDIVVECTVENVDLSGTPNTARVGNGYLAVWYKDTLGGEWTKENIVITDSTNGKVTVNVNRASAKFMKVSLKSTAEPVAE